MARIWSRSRAATSKCRAAAAVVMRRRSRSTHFDRAPFEQGDGAFDQYPVGIAADQTMTGRTALADLMEQAGARPAAAARHRVAAQGKNAMDLLERVAHRRRRGERPEITGSVRTHPADHGKGRELLAQIEPQGDEGLVVAQVDVVAGPVLLDQGVFEEQGLLLGIGDDGFDTASPARGETAPGGGCRVPACR